MSTVAASNLKALLALAAAGATLVGAVWAADFDAATEDVVVVRVIDGDTVEIDSGERVRLIGIDTPEVRTCGYREATAALREIAEGQEATLRNPDSVQDEDVYGRLLRYVDIDAVTDPGILLIRGGLAVARYDSRDGYDPHPREAEYRDADAQVVGRCESSEGRRAHDAEVRARAIRVANRAGVVRRPGEDFPSLLVRARRVVAEQRAEARAEARERRAARERARDRERAREAAREQDQQPPAPAGPNSGFTPPPGWTTDALTPGYSGCRQGYPGGHPSGVYVWKPIPC